MAACSSSSTSSATLPVIGRGANSALGLSSSRSSDLAPRAGDTTEVADNAAALVRMTMAELFIPRDERRREFAELGRIELDACVQQQ
jgi:hypothetical protein